MDGRLLDWAGRVRRAQGGLRGFEAHDEQSELGLDAQVSVRTMNGHTSVGVRLAAPPTGDAAAAKAQITDVVNRSFRAKVERVEISF